MTSPPRQPETLLGMGWLYALHARSSVARGRTLQALHMINNIRDQVVSLACLRCGLPPDQGRGADDLPGDIRRKLAESVVCELEPGELNRSLAVVVEALMREAESMDPPRSSRLRGVLAELVRTAALGP